MTDYRAPIEADEDPEALCTLEYQQPVTGKPFFLEEVSFDKDKRHSLFAGQGLPIKLRHFRHLAADE